MNDSVRDRLVAAGIVDENDPYADDRVKAFELMVERGADLDEAIAGAHDLGYTAAKIALGTRPVMTRRQLAERCGVDLEVIDRLTLALGFPDPGPDVPWSSEDDVQTVQLVVAAFDVFGEATAVQLARVVGASTARLAEALGSAFRTSVASRVTDPSGLEMVRTNFEVADLLPPFVEAIGRLLRRHLALAARPLTEATGEGYDATMLAIGFVDLAGSTALAERLGLPELSAALTDFEATACDTVVAHGGRVVKLIGDEVMFANADPAAACATAADLVAAIADHDVLTGSRAGIAFGEVLTRDGDCFGAPVTTAARLVAFAEAGQILADSAAADALGEREWHLSDVGTRELKGFSQPIRVQQVTRVAP